MYLSLRQLEQRSVQTPTIDEPVHPEPPLFERRPNSISSRPYSAKDDNVVLKSINVRPGRPVSATKQVPASMANLMRKPRLMSPRKERDIQALAKLRPRKIAIDKERLYDDAMHLKIENNELRTENIRLKTKISQLDRELSKAFERLDDAVADRTSAVSVHLVASLKQTIKEQKQALKLKELEVTALKKSARSTKIEEMEVELQTYAEECRRLQTALNELMAYQHDRKESPPRDDHDTTRREVAQLKSELKKLRIDNKNQSDCISTMQQQLAQEHSRGKDTDADDLQRRLSAQVEQTRRLTEHHSEEVDRLRRQHAEELENIRAQMRAQQSDFEQKVKAAEKDKQQEVAKAQAFATEISHLRDRFQEQSDSKHTFQESLETALQRAKGQLKSAEEELEQVKEENVQLDGQVTDISKALAEKEEEASAFQSQLSDLRQELEASKARTEDLEDAVSSLREAKSRLEDAQSAAKYHEDKLSQEKQDVLQKLAESDAAIASLKEKLRAQELQTSAMVEEHQTQITALVMEHREQLAEASVRRSALKDLEASKETAAQVKGDNDRLQSELALKGTEIGSLKKALAKKDEEMEELRRQLSSAEKENAFLRSAHASMSQRFSQILTPHFARIRQCLNLDDLYSEEQEVDSAESFEQKLKSAHLDDTVSSLLISQLSDGMGNVSIKKLRQELTLAVQVEESEEMSEPVEFPKPEEERIVHRTESRQSHSAEAEAQPLFPASTVARLPAESEEPQPTVATGLHPTELKRPESPEQEAVSEEIVHQRKESESEKADDEYEEEQFEAEVVAETDTAKAPDTDTQREDKGIVDDEMETPQFEPPEESKELRFPELSAEPQQSHEPAESPRMSQSPEVMSPHDSPTLPQVDAAPPQQMMVSFQEFPPAEVTPQPSHLSELQLGQPPEAESLAEKIEQESRKSESSSSEEDYQGSGFFDAPVEELPAEAERRGSGRLETVDQHQPSDSQASQPDNIAEQLESAAEPEVSAEPQMAEVKLTQLEDAEEIREEPSHEAIQPEVVESLPEKVPEPAYEQVLEASLEKAVESPHEEVKSPNQEVVETPPEEIADSPREEMAEVQHEKVTKSPHEEVVESPREEGIGPPNQDVVDSPHQEVVGELLEEIVEPSHEEKVAEVVEEVVETPQEHVEITHEVVVPMKKSDTAARLAGEDIIEPLKEVNEEVKEPVADTTAPRKSHSPSSDSSPKAASKTSERIDEEPGAAVASVPSEPSFDPPPRPETPFKSQSSSPRGLEISAVVEEAKDQFSYSTPALQYGDTFGEAKNSKAEEPVSSPRNHRTTELCRHISYRMQISRIPKENLIELLFEKEPQASTDAVKARLEEAPLGITDSEDQRLLIRLLSDKGQPQAALTYRLTDLMEDWRIFSQDDENEFDKDIADALNEHAGEFEQLCTERDLQVTGFITFQQFMEVLGLLGIQWSTSLLRYLQLLFYSEDQRLDAVPYATLLRVFAGSEELSEPRLSESQSAQVRTLLHTLVSRLEAKSLRLHDVFKTDSRHLISPEEFREGLEAMGMRLAEEDLELLVQSLQAEEANEICISMEDLEDIFASLSQHADDRMRSKKSSGSEFNEYFPHRLEYSQESPDVRGKSPISEASPFLSEHRLHLHSSPSPPFT